MAFCLNRRELNTKGAKQHSVAPRLWLVRLYRAEAWGDSSLGQLASWLVHRLPFWWVDWIWGHTFSINSFQAAQLLGLLCVLVLFPVAVIKYPAQRNLGGKVYLGAKFWVTVYHCRMVHAAGTEAASASQLRVENKRVLLCAQLTFCLI